VAAVDDLEEGNLGISGQVDILGAIGNELEKTTTHCRRSICILYGEKNYLENYY